MAVNIDEALLAHPLLTSCLVPNRPQTDRNQSYQSGPWPGYWGLPDLCLSDPIEEISI